MNFLRQAVAYAALAAALQPSAAAQATSSNTACGLAADRAAVEAAVVDRFRTESRHPLDATYILHLVALRGWARVDVESKGEFTEWFAYARSLDLPKTHRISRERRPARSTPAGNRAEVERGRRRPRVPWPALQESPERPVAEASAPTLRDKRSR